MKTSFYTTVLTTFFLLSNSLVWSQSTTEINAINKILDTKPYFDWLDLEYTKEFQLPDSTQNKIVKMLNRELPKHFIDSALTIQNVIIQNIENTARKECGNDTMCFQKKCEEYYKRTIEQRKVIYYTYCFNRTLILACGSWHIQRSIPYLEKELTNTRCQSQQQEIKMALAKLGNDSIYKVIKESCTLTYLSLHKGLDTVNSRINYGSREEDIIYGCSYEYEFLSSYFRDKSFLYFLIDFLYVKGSVSFQSLDHTSAEIALMMGFTSMFKDNPQRGTWEKICWDYLKKLSNASIKKNKKDFHHLTSRTYKQKLIMQMKVWIDENITY